jgi:HSP20 family protein
MPRGITIRPTDNISPEINRLDEQVRRRAYELSRADGAAHDPSANWLRAEQDVSWRPAVELRRKDNAFVVLAALAGLEPDQVEVAVTPHDLLVQSDIVHRHSGDEGEVHVCEFHRGRLFRAVHFPEAIAPDRMKAEMRNGLLRITAPLAGAADPIETPRKAARKRKSAS